ncbi:unnamed protein product [Cunninghamella echinulata]
MIRYSLSRYSSLIKRLLPACDGDASVAKRQLIWMKEKIIQDRNDPKNHQPLDQKEFSLLEYYIQQRVEQHKPLQYILGTQPFYNLDIITRPPTLIPRWETEEWTHKLVNILYPTWEIKKENNQQQRRRRIMDICTGTGCIALGLATHLPPQSTVIKGIDISQDAIQLARENLKRHQSMLNDNEIDFQVQDICDPTASLLLLNNEATERIDLFVSNPPYVTHEEYNELDPEVKQWEDKCALVADHQGTFIHKKIIQLVSQHKRQFKVHDKDEEKLPSLVMEIGGEHQVLTLTEELKKYDFKNIQVWKDLAGKDRLVLAN